MHEIILISDTDILWISDGHPWNIAGCSSDVCGTSIMSTSDVRQTSDGCHCIVWVACTYSYHSISKLFSADVIALFGLLVLNLTIVFQSFLVAHS
jgi:hypothetical protein